MQRTLPRIAALASLVCAVTAAQGVPLFSASSKAQGASFDLVVTETQRLPTKSYLTVPGFHERTAPGARWLMCAYTALAMERGFSHWFVVYPPEGSSRVVVGLSNSPGASPLLLLGSDYVQSLAVGEQMMPVEKMAAFCGIKR